MRFALPYRLIFCLTFLISKAAFAQDPPFINYNEQNGLSTSVVYGLFQDSEDNIWFCTNSGPVKFNGNKLIPYKKKDRLAGNEVFKIFEDSQHRLWFMTASGQVSYYKNKKIYNEKDHPVFSKLKINSFIADIGEDENNNIWIIPDRGNIYALSASLDSYKEVTGQLFNGSFFTYKNLNYISSREGIFSIDKGLTQLSFQNFSPSTLNARHCFSGNLVYIGRDKKVEIYNMQTKVASYFETPDLPLSINSIGIIDSLIYICSNKGLTKAIITSSNRTVKKNDITGVILYRYISVTGTCKNAEGKCFTQEFTFRQDYSGGGNYESNPKCNSYGGKREIGCDKIK